MDSLDEQYPEVIEILDLLEDSLNRLNQRRLHGESCDAVYLRTEQILETAHRDILLLHWGQKDEAPGSGATPTS